MMGNAENLAEFFNYNFAKFATVHESRLYSSLHVITLP